MAFRFKYPAVLNPRSVMYASSLFFNRKRVFPQIRNYAHNMI